jgi:cell division FtsZ-interacting protein ZapD
VVAKAVEDVVLHALTEVRGEISKQRDVTTHILTVLERQQATLDEHVRRTDIAERQLDAFRTELTPLKAHAAAWALVGKAISGLALVVGLIVGLLKILEHFGR